MSVKLARKALEKEGQGEQPVNFSKLRSLGLGTGLCFALACVSASAGAGERAGDALLGTLPDLALSVTDSPDPVLTGGTVTYSFSLNNNAGTSPATGVAISVFYSAALTPNPGPTPGWTCNGGSPNLCQLAAGTLNVGSSAPTLQLSFTAPTTAQSVQVIGTASSVEPDLNTSNNNATQNTQVIAGAADLSLGLNASAASVATGQAFSYTATVTNLGPANATSLQVTGTLSGQVSFSSFSVSGAWSCTHNSGAITCNYASGSPTGTLAAGIAASPIVVNVVAGNSPGSAQLSMLASSTATDPTPASASASVSVTGAGGGVADVGISKQVVGASTIPQGTPFNFRLRAGNAGNSPQAATGVQIIDNLPAGLTLNSATGSAWSCTGTTTITCNYGLSILPGQFSSDLDLNVSWLGAPPLGVQINTASVSAAQTDPNPGNNNAAASFSIQAQADLALQWSGPTSAVIGSSYTQTLSAANGGPSAAANVVVTANLPTGTTPSLQSTGAGWSCNLAGLNLSCTRASFPLTPSGSVAVLSLSAPGTLGPALSSTASISADTLDPGLGNNSATLSTTLDPGSPALQVTKTDSADPVRVGTDFTYAIAVRNSGNVALSGVSVTDPLPSQVEYRGFTGAGWSCSGSSTITCNLAGSLAAGATSTLSLNVRAQSAGQANNTAQAAAPQLPAAVSASQSTQIQSSAELSFVKTARQSQVAVGARAQFDLSVDNRGDSNVNSLVLIDDLPAGTRFVSALGEGWNCNASGQTVDCRRDVLAPLGRSSVVIEVEATTVGSLINRARLSALGLNATLLANATLVVIEAPASADLSIDKSDSADPVQAGAEFDYRLRVRNAGPAAATGVRVTDNLPAGLEFVSAQGSGWQCAGTQNISCDLAGSLAVGAESTVSLRVRTASSANAPISNIASVSAQQTDPVSSNNSDGESTAVQPRALSADLSLTATASAVSVPAGGSFDINATLRNAGPDAAGSFTLSITPAAGLSIVSGEGSGINCAPVGSGFECRGASLAVNEQRAIRLLARSAASASSSLGVALALTSSTPDPQPANNGANLSVRVDAVAPTTADLSISKTDSADPVVIGDRYTYTITVRNLGPAAAEGVLVRDLLPGGLRLISASGSGFTCSGVGPIDCRLGTPLANAAQAVLTIEVQAPSQNAVFTNVATVSANTNDPLQTNNRAEQATTIILPDQQAGEELLEQSVGNDGFAGEAIAPVAALCQGARGPVDQFCRALYSDAAAGNDVGEDLRAVFPEEVLSQYAAINQLADTQFANVDARMSEWRGGGAAGGMSLAGLTVSYDGQSIPLSLFNGLLSEDDPEIGGSGDLISPWGFFVNGFVSRGDQSVGRNDREVLTDFDAMGLTAGVDYRRSADWVMGAAVGFNDFDSDLTDDGQLSTRGWTLTGYTSYYARDNLYVDARVSYGQLSLDQQRRIAISLSNFQLNELARGSTDASQLSFASSTGMHFNRGPWNVTPNLSLRWMRASVDGFAETGGGGFGVRYGDHSISSLVMGAGLQINRVFSLSNGVLTPQFDLAWNRELRNDGTEVDAAFLNGDQGELILLQPESVDKSYGSIGLGFVYVMANGRQAYLQWRENVGTDGLDRSTLNIGGRFEF